MCEGVYAYKKKKILIPQAKGWFYKMAYLTSILKALYEPNNMANFLWKNQLQRPEAPKT
jgi:hypothetical protein